MRNSRVRCIERAGPWSSGTGKQVIRSAGKAQLRGKPAPLKTKVRHPKLLTRTRTWKSCWLFGNEVGGVAPLAGHNEIADGLAGTRSGFAIAIGLWKRSRVAGVADGKSGDGIPAGGNCKDFASGFGIEAGHLVNEEAAGSGFDAEHGHGGAGVILSVAVGSLIFGEVEFGDGKAENVGVSSPVGIELNERLKGFGEVGVVVVRSDDESPRLFVA